MADDIQLSYVGDKADGFLDVKFYKRPNEITGEDEDYIRIVIPGNSCTVVEEPVNETYKQRFFRQWEAYQMKHELTGTPLTDWTDLPDSMRRELMRQDFNFVEQVAGAPDSAFTRIPGGHQWRLKAQNFLNRGKLTAEQILAQQKEQLDAQQAQIDAMKAEMTEFMASMAPKRGRPPLNADL